MEIKMKTENVTMTKGPIFRQIILFAIPLVLTSILQQLYNTMDSVVIGRFSSSLAFAGVGGSASLIALATNLFIGLSTGASIVAAQCFGARDKDGVEKTVHTSVAMSIICGIFMTFIGLMITRPALIAMDTPEEVLPYAAKYTSIYFLGILPTLLYCFLAGILRAVGDSKRPLYYLIISAALNVVLNLFFVVILKMDVDGVAIATIISQTLCCVLALARLTRVHDIYRFDIKKLKIHRAYLIKILRIGVPTGLNSCLFSISNVVIQSTINKFGAAAVAGCSADMIVENFVYMPMNAIGIAATTFAGQNMGAGLYDRIRKGMWCSLALVTAVGLALGLSTMMLGSKVLKLFINSADAGIEDIIKFGLERMNVVSVSYFLCGMMEVVGGTIRGLGNSFMPMIITFFGVCGLRILWIYTILPFNNTIGMLFISYPLSWLVSIIGLFIYYCRTIRIKEKGV